MTILHIDASARTDLSTSRDLSARLVAGLPGPVIRRDLNTALPLIDEAWVAANFTPDSDRDDASRKRLHLSDTLVQELQDADTIVIGLPIYNFGVPAALKAWIDLVCRAGKTFKYNEKGPIGLLENKRAFIIVTSGGTEVGSSIDFATGYMRHVLGFIGITDVQVIDAGQLVMDDGSKLEQAKTAIDAITKSASGTAQAA